jgi:hypothetical protein
MLGRSAAQGHWGLHFTVRAPSKLSAIGIKA